MREVANRQTNNDDYIILLGGDNQIITTTVIIVVICHRFCIFSEPFTIADAELSSVSRRHSYDAIVRDDTAAAADRSAFQKKSSWRPITTSKFHALADSSSSSLSSSSASISSTAKKPATTDSAHKKRSRAAFSRSQVGLSKLALQSPPIKGRENACYDPGTPIPPSHGHTMTVALCSYRAYIHFNERHKKSAKCPLACEFV